MFVKCDVKRFSCVLSFPLVPCVSFFVVFPHFSFSFNLSFSISTLDCPLLIHSRFCLSSCLSVPLLLPLQDHVTRGRCVWPVQWDGESLCHSRCSPEEIGLCLPVFLRHFKPGVVPAGHQHSEEGLPGSKPNGSQSSPQEHDQPQVNCCIQVPQCKLPHPLMTGFECVCVPGYPAWWSMWSSL